MKLRILFGFMTVLAVVALDPLPVLCGTVSPRVETHTVASSDGVPIVYDVQGKGPVTLVFVHCWACNRHFWRNQTTSFSRRYRVVTIDLGGHGDSGEDRKAWTVPSLARDVIAVADDLKLRRMILVGHSLGGRVCLRAAPLMKGRVLGVVLVDIMHDASRRVTEAEAQADVAKLRSDYKGYFSDLSPLFSKTADPGVVHWVEAQAMASAPEPMIGLKLDIPNEDPADLFRQAGVPIRAINALPPLSDATNIAGNKRYADYEVIFVPDAGHFLMLERPAAFNRALARWVRVLSGGHGILPQVKKAGDAL